MRPVTLRFRGFGPYVDEQFVDFEALEKGGLFLICGDTGAGKTTILDAMCCALYGESSGGSRGSFEAMRCKTATREEPTALEFVFDHNGKRYVFTRELKFARKNLNDHHGCMIEQDGVRVPLVENPTKSAVNRMAEEIIGLTVSQFRQVIILPQGKFETLLTSDSVAKEAILTSIFDAEKWDAIAALLSNRIKERDAALKTESAALAAVWTRYGCDGAQALTVRAQNEKEQLCEKQTALEKAQTAYAAMQKTLEEMIAAEQPFGELESRMKHYEQLTAQASDFAKEEAALNLADSAEAMRTVFESYDAARRAAKSAAEAVETALQTAAAADKAEQTAKAAVAAHEETAAAAEDMSREAVRLQEKQALYKELPVKREAIGAAEEQAEYTAERLEKAVAAQTDADARLMALRENQAAAIAVCEQAEERYFRGIGGVLATTLQEGKPCPVCGSTTHPAPAVANEDSISEEEFKTYKERRSQAIAAFDTAQTAAAAAREAATAAAMRHREATQAAELAKAAWEQALQQKVAGIDTADQLEKRLRECRTAKETYEATASALREAFVKAAGETQRAKALLEQAQETAERAATELSASQNAWEETLAASVFADETAFASARLPFEEREKRKAALQSEKAALVHAKEEVALWQARVGDKPRPQVEAQKAQNEQAAAELETLRREVTLAQNALEALERDTADVQKRLKTYAVERQKADADLEFSRRISGSSGISLKRYVLGVMLTNITVQANHLLSQVYGGRYRLYRTDDIAGSGHKGGLELEVLDQYNNERRSVTTLSGGEKFLVALSLAIGLSAVVQAQGKGVRLEAMFVDEGFGSLSREAVGDAIEILQGVRESSGIVGIISHVDKLAETIPNRIEITKTSKGSRLKVITN